MNLKPSKRQIKRALRVAAFVAATGLAFMGAGNVYGYSAIDSALFGATGSVLALAIALLMTYASKGEVTDKDFDKHINEAVESVSSKTAKDDQKK